MKVSLPPEKLTCLKKVPPRLGGVQEEQLRTKVTDPGQMISSVAQVIIRYR